MLRSLGLECSLSLPQSKENYKYNLHHLQPHYVRNFPRAWMSPSIHPNCDNSGGNDKHLFQPLSDFNGADQSNGASGRFCNTLRDLKWFFF